MRTIWWIFLIILYASATLFFHPKSGLTADLDSEPPAEEIAAESEPNYDPEFEMDPEAAPETEQIETNTESEMEPEPESEARFNDEADASTDAEIANEEEDRFTPKDESIANSGSNEKPTNLSIDTKNGTKMAEAQSISEGATTVDSIGPELRKDPRWYRTPGEWIAARTTRDGLTLEPVAKILSDGKRFDVGLGKRVPVFSWGEESLTKAWSAGFDGGMMVTMFRGRENTNVTFATENFDGFFGAYVARSLYNTIYMLRVAHVSSHLVDNNPRVLTAIPYSRFWLEAIVGRTFPAVDSSSPWNLHIQGALGFNFTSDPARDSMRYLFGFDLGYNLFGPDSLAIISSFDLRHTGVAGQSHYFATFLGLGRTKRPETTNRPWRIGVSHHWGSDYRNQYFRNTDKFTSMEVQLEF